ncbi:putative ubiquitin-conjugating enzyme E2 7 [Nosema granulosis]|uniref:Ubiquitin-conjugating enzyme E2 7 n=1 Tax=Nosema granulosis TaxID=83296 RepID=A0A9P6L0U5_9MICR|nr:putative ubiquitin-conjugating enzyme E2 7 [Nosema granulosis]
MENGEGNRSLIFIANEYGKIQKKANDHFSVGLIDDNFYTWEVLIFGPRDTPFENGIFRAKMIFPVNYPEAPPTFRFISEMWHPNIDREGNVCISILHNPGEDVYGYESLGERWMPVRHPESVIISITSLLSAPNCDSPANIDAAHDYKNNPEVYRKKVMRLTEKTLE